MLKSGLTYCICLSVLLCLISCKSDVKQAQTNDSKTSQKIETVSPKSQLKQETSEAAIAVKASQENSLEEKEVQETPKEKMLEAPKKKEKIVQSKPKKSTVTSVPPAPQKKTVYAKPAIEFETMTHDFGKLEEGETYDYAFKFKNTGNEPLEITSASGSCGCAQPSFPFLEIPPGGTNQIGVHYNSVNKEGDQNPEIFVTTNVNDAKIKLTLTGTVNVSEERRKEKEEAIKKQKEAIAKAGEERRKKREAQEKITKARVDSILQAQKDTSGTIDPK